MMHMFPLSVWPTDKKKFETTKVVLTHVIHPVLWAQQIHPSFPVPPYLAVNSEARLLLAIKSMDALSRTTTSAELVDIHRLMIRFCLTTRYGSTEVVPAWALDLQQTQILRAIFTYLLEVVDCCRTCVPVPEQLETFCEAHTRLIRYPAWVLELSPWDLTTALTDFAACIDCGRYLKSEYSLRKMHEFYQTGSEVLMKRASDGDLLARRQLQIFMSVEFNELVFAAGFDQERQKVVRRRMRTMAGELGFALQLEVSVMHAKISKPFIRPQKSFVEADKPPTRPCETPALCLTGMGLLTSAFDFQVSVVKDKEDAFLVGEEDDQSQAEPAEVPSNHRSACLPQNHVADEKEADHEQDAKEKTLLVDVVDLVGKEREQPKRVFNNLRNKIAGMSVFRKT
jgi:hypothetical protein